MTIFQLAVVQPKKMLRNLDAWLAKGAALAEEKKFAPDVLLQQRLAPDQFALLRQVQSACDGAKLMAARLADVEAPKHEDTEKTYEEIRARIGKAVSFLEGIDPESMKDAADRKIVLGFLPEGAWVRGEEYLTSFALPNFYFHVSHAYAVLRHNGVDLGKKDFIGGMDIQGM